MARIDMRRVCVNRTHTLDCQHNVTLTSQVLAVETRLSGSFFSLFFFRPRRLLLDNESEMMAAKCTPY